MKCSGSGDFSEERRAAAGGNRRVFPRARIPAREWAIGEVAEWSIAAVLKTVEVKASVGSNPTLSATNPCLISLYRIRALFPRHSGRLQTWICD